MDYWALNATVFLLLWLMWGYTAGALYFAYFQRKWPEQAQEAWRSDRKFALGSILFGPIGLLSLLWFLSRHGWFKYGIDLGFWRGKSSVKGYADKLRTGGIMTSLPGKAGLAIPAGAVVLPSAAIAAAFNQATAAIINAQKGAQISAAGINQAKAIITPSARIKAAQAALYIIVPRSTEEPKGEPHSVVGLEGWRIYVLDRGESEWVLISPSYRAHTMTGRVSDPAKCMPDALFDDITIPPHPAPAWSCMCGHYALDVPPLSMLSSMGPSAVMTTKVLARVSAVGHTIIGEQGWRAERLRLEEIYVPAFFGYDWLMSSEEKLSPFSEEEKQSIATQFQVPVSSQEELYEHRGAQRDSDSHP